MALLIFEGTDGRFVSFTDDAEAIPPGAVGVTVSFLHEGFKDGTFVPGTRASAPGKVWWQEGAQFVYVDSGTLEQLKWRGDLRLRLEIAPEGEKEDPDARRVGLWAYEIYKEVESDDEATPLDEDGDEEEEEEEEEEIRGTFDPPSEDDKPTAVQSTPNEGEEEEEEEHHGAPPTDATDVAEILQSNAGQEPSARSPSDPPVESMVIETVPRAPLGTVVQTTFNMHQLGARMSSTKLGRLLASGEDFDPDFLPSDLSAEEQSAYWRLRKEEAELRKEGSKDAKIDVVLSAIKGAELNAHPIDVASFHEVSNADTFANGLMQNAGKYGLQIGKDGDPGGAASDGATQYTLATGPLMETGGEGGAQKEYYPILFRKDRFELQQVRYFVTDKKESAPLRNVPADEKISTGKGKSRPLIVYTLKSKTEPGAPPLHVVVVHTKPNASHRVSDKSGDESTGPEKAPDEKKVKARYKIYDQVKNAYKHAKEDAETTGARWTFIGDHYLANNEHAEPGKTFEKAVEDLGLTSHDPIPKTNTHEKMDTELSTFRALATLRKLERDLAEAAAQREQSAALLAYLDKAGSLGEDGQAQLASIGAWIKRHKRSWKPSGKTDRERLEHALAAVEDISGGIDGSRASAALEALAAYKERTKDLEQALEKTKELTASQREELLRIASNMNGLGKITPKTRDQTIINRILKRIPELEAKHGKDTGKRLAAERRRDEGKDRTSPFLRTGTLEARIKDLQASIAALEEQEKAAPPHAQQAITERIARFEAALEQAGRELEAARQFQASIGDRSGASHLDRGSAQVADKGVGTNNNSVNLTGIVALRAAAGLHDPELKDAGRFLTSDAQNSELARTMVYSDHAMFVWVSSDKPEDKERIDAMADDRPPPRLPSSAFGLESDDEGGEDDDPDDEDMVSGDEMDDESTLAAEEEVVRKALKRSRADFTGGEADEGDSMDEGSSTTSKAAQKAKKKEPPQKRKKVEKGPKKPVGSTHVGAVKAPGKKSRTKAQTGPARKKKSSTSRTSKTKTWK